MSPPKFLDQTLAAQMEQEESERLNPSDMPENPNPVRLRGGIRLQDLLDPSQSVVMEPVVDEQKFDAQGNTNYFDDQLNLDKINLEEFMPNHVDDAHLDDGDNFEAAAQRMDPVTEDGGIVKRIVVRPGPQMEAVPEFATVTINYTIFVSGLDEPLDSTELRGVPERYSIPDGGLLEGLEIAVRSMRKGERSHFVLQPKYYMGEGGCYPRVPPHTPVLAKMELLDVKEASGSECLLSHEDKSLHFSSKRVKEALSFEHRSGNKAYKEDRIHDAHRHYFLAIRLLEKAKLEDEQDEKEYRRLMLKMCLNRSQCSIRLNEAKRACLDLQKALEIDPKNVKALYRMGKAKRLIQNHEDALKYFERARSVEPHNSEIGQEIMALREWLKGQKEQQMETYANMFNLQSQDKVDRDQDLEEELELDKQEIEFKEKMIEKIEAFLNKTDAKEKFFFPPIDGNCPKLVKIVKQVVNGMGKEYDWCVVNADGRQVKKLRVIK